MTDPTNNTPVHVPHVPAALVSMVIAALGGAQRLSQWGVTADQVAAVLGLGMFVVSGGFALWERWRKGA